MIETEHLDVRRVFSRTAGCRRCAEHRVAVDIATAGDSDRVVVEAQRAMDDHRLTHRP